MPSDLDLPTIRLADIEVGGDIHRIILDGIAVPPGIDARALRGLIMGGHDGLRGLMLNYPYGNQDMCADLLFPSALPDAASGYVIMECMGYPHYSGSNTMAVVAALVEYGRIPLGRDWSSVTLEAPSGPIAARYREEAERLAEVAVRGDDSYVIEDGLTADLPGIGTVPYALVWSGACFLAVEAGPLGIEITPEHLPRMKQVGAALIEAIRPSFARAHPEIGPIDTVGFVHFMGPLEADGQGGMAARGATYGYPATVFNCPTGTGVAARMAVEVSRGRLADDAVLTYRSPPGHVFVGTGLGPVERGGHPMLGVSVAAAPRVLATNDFHVDFDNPLLAPFADMRPLLARE